jgi:hypothetical protein
MSELQSSTGDSEGFNSDSAGPHNWRRTMDAGVTCPICQKPDGCLVSADDPNDPKAVICIRETSAAKLRFGFLHIRKPEGDLSTASTLADNGNPAIIVEGATDTAIVPGDSLPAETSSPKPPPIGPQPMPQLPGVTSEQFRDLRGRIEKAGSRSRIALGKISEALPSFSRSMVEGYVRFLGPTLRLRGASEFPATVRRQPGDPERCAHGDSKYHVLYFYIGNAILGYYDALNLIVDVKPRMVDPLIVLPAIHTLERRVEFLEEIAASKHGLLDFRIEGDDKTGYALVAMEK